MFTPRPGCYIAHDAGTFGPGDMIAEDHPCVARNRGRLMRAPESGVAGPYSTREERATPEPPAAPTQPRDADERERQTIKPGDVGRIEDLL